MSYPQIWNKEKEEDGEKEKVGDRPTKLNEKKSDGELAREKKAKETFFCWKNNIMKFCSGGEKIRNTIGHQSEN